MKHKDIIILQKICNYCEEAKEACEMFKNDFEEFPIWIMIQPGIPFRTTFRIWKPR